MSYPIMYISHRTIGLHILFLKFIMALEDVYKRQAVPLTPEQKKFFDRWSNLTPQQKKIIDELILEFK